MKKTGKVICYIFASLIIVFSSIFIVFEARNLFSGDWLIYENKADGFVRYLFRLIIAIFSLIVGVFTYISLNKKARDVYKLYFYFGSITLLVSSTIIACYSSNYIDLLFIVLSVFYFLGALLYLIGDRLSAKRA